MTLPVVAVINQTTVLSDTQVQPVVAALQRQVSEHFKEYYCDCTLEMLPKTGTIPDGWWQLVLLDDPDMAGALGYHELTAQGLPLGKVFAKLDLDNGLSWSVTASHELLEMLADPWINWIVQGEDDRLYALEVADAVEADNLGYTIDGVLVSDFVTPNWFEPTANDRFDFKQHLSSRLQLAPGGYISILDPKKGWIQINNFEKEDVAKAASIASPVGSRRFRRTVAKRLWRKSAR